MKSLRSPFDEMPCYAKPQSNPAKHKAVSITLHRAEGPTLEIGTVTVKASPEGSVWREANHVLSKWSSTAPEKGKGYDKVDFTITYDDDETYKGRYDLMHFTAEYPDLVKHVKSFVEFHAGRKPSWMDDQTFKAYQEQFSSKLAEGYKNFLENYEIGEDLIRKNPSGSVPIKFWMAWLESRSFDFKAFGETEAKAKKALEDRLRKHCKEYGVAKFWTEDEIETAIFQLNKGYRDDEDESN